MFIHRVQNSRCFFFFFPLSKLNISLRSSCLHDFLEVRCSSCLCSSIVEGVSTTPLPPPQLLSGFFLYCSSSTFETDMDGCRFFGIYSFLVFSELPGSVVWCLTLIWGNSQPLLFQIFLHFLFFSQLGILIMNMLNLCSCPTNTYIFCSIFISFCSFCFWVCGVSIDITSSPDSLLSSIPVY